MCFEIPKFLKDVDDRQFSYGLEEVVNVLPKTLKVYVEIQDSLDYYIIL